jgi:pimeloyl-ACP methyl ester carboxylesterase
MSSGRESWPPGSRSRVMNIGGAVHITEYGEPQSIPVVVCLHGLGGSALNFGLVAPLLAEDRRIVVPDLLGHGRSPAPVAASGHALDAQLNTLELLIEDVSDGPVVLIGHSMGGILAILHATRTPAQVSRLVLIDPPVPNVTRFRRDPRLTAKLALLSLPGINGVVTRQVMKLTPEQLVARQLSHATSYSARIPQAAVKATIAEVRDARAKDGGRAAQRAQFQAILEVVALLARPGDWRRQLASVSVPTLWLQGEDDPLASMPAARALAATRSAWTFKGRPGVGHLPHLEDCAWTASTIAEWLIEVDAAGSD